MFTSYAEWWSLQRARPLGTAGSPGRSWRPSKDVRGVEEILVEDPRLGVGLDAEGKRVG
jgi:hypothetical protein